MKKKRVLFYCKHNSCRSQMAEAYLRHVGKDDFEVYSAGLFPELIHPLVEVVMNEIGISIEGQTSKSVEMYLGKQTFDYVIIVCKDSETECPKLYPFSLHLLNWPLSDPAEVTASKEVVLEAFRSTRDEIIGRIDSLLASLE